MNIELIAVRRVVGEVVHFRGVDRTPNSSERGDDVVVAVEGLDRASELDNRLEMGDRPVITVDRVVSRFTSRRRLPEEVWS